MPRNQRQDALRTWLNSISAGLFNTVDAKSTKFAKKMDSEAALQKALESSLSESFLRAIIAAGQGNQKALEKFFNPPQALGNWLDDVGSALGSIACKVISNPIIGIAATAGATIIGTPAAGGAVGAGIKAGGSLCGNSTAGLTQEQILQQQYQMQMALEAQKEHQQMMLLAVGGGILVLSLLVIS